jgi:hypothetical protein
MVAKYRAIGCMCGVVLLNIRVVLHVLGLVGILMLEVVHCRHPSPTSSIDPAMLPLLMVLIEHAVEVLRWRMRIR